MRVRSLVASASPRRSSRARPRILGWALAAIALSSCGKAPAEEKSASASDADSTLGMVVLEPPNPDKPWSVDMGHIPLGEVREHVVRLKNVEGRELVVRSLQAGCSCTKPEIAYVAEDGTRTEGDPNAKNHMLKIPADGIAELKLRIDSREAPLKNQPKLVIVRMATDSEHEPYLTLEVRLQVDAPFQVVPPLIDLHSVAQNAGGTGSASLVAVSSARLSIAGVLSASPGLRAEIESAMQGETPIWKLSVTLDPPVPLGNFDAKVVLSTLAADGSEGPTFEVRVVANGVPDVQFLPARFLLASDAANDAAAPEESQVELLSHLPGQKLMVKGARAEGDAHEHLRIELEPVAPDDSGRSARWRIRLIATADLGAQALSGTVVLDLADEELPSVSIPYMRRAR